MMNSSIITAYIELPPLPKTRNSPKWDGLFLALNRFNSMFEVKIVFSGKEMSGAIVIIIAINDSFINFSD
jgi:hypothetical protein